ncbi:MAG TPA: hypothetical protein VKR83_09260 [Ktedonobacteraceae bacterium]|nr:hypothetical protein [Ktedonobacteraceae bacterium]
MTRDFNKQRRDDERPDSRNSSSGRYGEERSPRPARPRLNRDTVDRAWENGARQNHADYRARNMQNGQSPRENWRRPQQSGQPSAYNGRTNNSGNSRTPYGNRADDRRPGERTPNRYQGSHPRPYESGMRKFDERQYSERRDHEYRPSGSETRPQPREGGRYPNNRTPSRDYEPRRDDRPANRFERDERPPRSFQRDDRSPRSFERDERPRGYYRERRQERAAGRPDPQNPRWQSRPQRFAPKSSNYPRQTSPREQFEGDYEQFDARTAPSAIERQREMRLPDNRAARRPREDQQRDAEFKAEIHQETANLIQHIEPVEQASNDTTGEAASGASPKTKKARAGAHPASAKVRSRKAAAKQSDTNPDTPHLRPSHRGFKWPEPQQTAEQTPEE